MGATGLVAAEPSTRLEPILLRDGTEVELHPMAAEDAAALVRFHRGLSSETARLRFFTIHPELSAAEIDRFTHVDHERREAIVATIDGEIVGVARFDRVPETNDAEAAFVIADRWQGLGLGRRLFDRLAERARELGVQRFVAEVLPHNRRMLNVFLHAGLPAETRFSTDVVEVAVRLS